MGQLIRGLTRNLSARSRFGSRVDSSPQLCREMPCAERIYQFLVERDEPEMLPEAIRVVDLRWHQRFFWTRVKAAST